MADRDYPNESIGLFVLSSDCRASVHTFDLDVVHRTPRRIVVTPQAVVAAVYDLDRQGLEIVGTVHSHPLAKNYFLSDGDRDLLWWGRWHLVCRLESGNVGWKLQWGTSYDCNGSKE